MKKKIFNIIIVLAVIIGACSATSVYAVASKETKSTASNNTVINQVNEVTTAEPATTTNAEETINTTTSETTEETSESGLSNHDVGLLATGLGCIGAGIAVAMVASSAIGAISENPSLLGKTIIFAGLAEGIAIYGLIISIMILNKI